jgi:hypothetical protein
MEVLLMSKKRKRQNRKSTRSEATQATRTASSSRVTEREFNPDYSYVKKDLTRIGALAGTFFVILIVLSFIIN